jgi:hypothetical protein
MDLAALADRPAVSRFLQGVCLDFEREGVSFDHKRILARLPRCRYLDGCSSYSNRRSPPMAETHA